LPAYIKSIEDHGIIFELGIESLTGFLSAEDAKLTNSGVGVDDKMFLGAVHTVCVSQVGDNGKVCRVSLNHQSIINSQVSALNLQA
jgi:rRNA biogenesis protein RRP5